MAGRESPYQIGKRTLAVYASEFLYQETFCLLVIAFGCLFPADEQLFGIIQLPDVASSLMSDGFPLPKMNILPYSFTQISALTDIKHTTVIDPVVP